MYTVLPYIEVYLGIRVVEKDHKEKLVCSGVEIGEGNLLKGIKISCNCVCNKSHFSHQYHHSIATLCIFYKLLGQFAVSLIAICR